MRELLEKFPTGGDAAAGLLLAGESFSDFSSPKAAREVLQRFESQFPGSPLKPQAEFAVARTFETDQNWPAAIARYEAWLKNFPANTLLPQVQFALGRANYKAANESAAFGLFTSFVACYPTNELAPLAQWWVAEHFFRAGEWVGAETNYEAVFQNPSPVWQTNTLALPARLMAGRAAMGRQGYRDAVGYFNALIDLLKTNGPAELGIQARFASGAALLNLDSSDTNNPLANVQLATNVFFQIVQSDPTNQSGARAWGEIGDCDIQLGDFDAATNAYMQVVSLDPADVSVRNAAQVGYGMALEKKAKLATGDDQKNLLQLALNEYLELLEPQEAADEFWVKNAGLQAAGVAEKLGDWTTARAIYARLQRELPQLAAELDKKIKIAEANQTSVAPKN
jgi:tetratricopeptide (TPR) repeat protein